MVQSERGLFRILARSFVNTVELPSGIPLVRLPEQGVILQWQNHFAVVSCQPSLERQTGNHDIYAPHTSIPLKKNLQLSFETKAPESELLTHLPDKRSLVKWEIDNANSIGVGLRDSECGVGGAGV